MIRKDLYKRNLNKNNCTNTAAAKRFPLN